MKIEVLREKIRKLEEKIQLEEAKLAERNTQKVQKQWLIDENISLVSVTVIRETKGYIFISNPDSENSLPIKIRKLDRVFTSHEQAKQTLIAIFGEKISIEEESLKALKSSLKRLNATKADQEFFAVLN